MFNINDTLAAAAANGIRTALNGGTLFMYAGTAPSSPDDALDMGGTHTQVAALSAGGGGLNFDSAIDEFLYKAASETWSGLVAFDGAEAGQASLTPTFFRFCQAGDNGRGAATGPRLQGTITGPSGNGDVKLASATVTANGSNEVGLAGFYFQIANLGG